MQMEQKKGTEYVLNHIPRITQGKKMGVTPGHPGVRFYSLIIYIPLLLNPQTGTGDLAEEKPRVSIFFLSSSQTF